MLHAKLQKSLEVIAGILACFILVACGPKDESTQVTNSTNKEVKEVSTWPDRRHLPIEPYQQVGELSSSLAKSGAIDWPKEISAPEGAPNVL
ncbi:MAG: hypothetical protein ACPGSJ_11425, partial [Pseudoalteromonas spongiae]